MKIKKLQLNIRIIEDNSISYKEIILDLTPPNNMKDVLDQICNANLGLKEEDLEELLGVKEENYNLLYQSATKYEGQFFVALQTQLDNSVYYKGKLYPTDSSELPKEFRPVEISIQLDENFLMREVIVKEHSKEIKLDFRYLLGTKNVEEFKNSVISFTWDKIKNQKLADLDAILKTKYAELFGCDEKFIQFDWKDAGLSKESSFEDGLNAIKQKGIKFLPQETLKIKFSISEYGINKDYDSEEIRKITSKKYALDLNPPKTVSDVLIEDFPHQFKKEDLDKPAISFKKQFEDYAKKISENRGIWCGKIVSKKVIDNMVYQVQSYIMSITDYESLFGYFKAKFTPLLNVNNDEISCGLTISFKKKEDAEAFNKCFGIFYKVKFDKKTEEFVLDLLTSEEVKWFVSLTKVLKQSNQWLEKLEEKKKLLEEEKDTYWSITLYSSSKKKKKEIYEELNFLSSLEECCEAAVKQGPEKFGESLRINIAKKIHPDNIELACNTILQLKLDEKTISSIIEDAKKYQKKL